jgi:hypothetical protein
MKAIIQKFTNYRQSRKKVIDDRTAEIEALKAAAAALVDLKTFSKGRTLFRRRMHTQIRQKKESIMADSPHISAIGAYQKAQKILWDEADQDHWEADAVAERNDIYE